MPGIGLLLLLLTAGQQVVRSTAPIDCPERKWLSAGVPYDEPGGPPRRHLVLSNGPEFITDGYIPAGSDHVNLYWGKIPFEGTDLRLRVYICHIFDPKGKLDSAEVRFCMGTRGGGGVRITRRDSTIGTSQEGAYQYIDPCRMQAMSHLGQKWQRSLAPGTTIPVPDESESGDVTDVAVTMKKLPVPSRYGDLVAEIDLKADRPMPGRSLIVRSVLRTPGGGLGVCRDETCCDSGAGERGWWPQADIYVRSDPAHPAPVSPGSASPFTSYFRLCERGRVDWGMFNNLTPDGKASITNNPLDRFGTKNSGLWGVNVLYRVYYRSNGVGFTPFRTAIAGYLKQAPAGHVVAGPFDSGDQPWSKYSSGDLRATFPGYVDRRSESDFDLADLGESGIADESVRYFEYFVANIGASTFPTALVIERPAKR